MTGAAAPDAASWIIGAAGVLVALGVIYRYLVRPIARTVGTIAQIGGDWYGREGDAGHPRVPGVMERLASIESEVKYNGGSRRLVDAVKDMEDAAVDLRKRAVKNAAGIAELKDGQAAAKDAAEKARDLAADVHSELHDYVEDGHLREQTYIASLHELGIEIEPQPHRDPHARTRADDDQEQTP